MISVVGAISTLSLLIVAVVFMIGVEVRQYHCRREMRGFEQFERDHREATQPRAQRPD